MLFNLTPILFVLVLLQFNYGNFQTVDDATWERAEKKCQTLSKIDSNQRASLLTRLGNISKAAKCYVNCFFEEVGLMKGSSVNSTLLHSWLEEESLGSQDSEALYTSIKSCVDDIKTADKCELAYELYVCFESR